MVTLKHLIALNDLQVEDPFEAKVIELAILENTTTKVIKSYTVVEIQKLLDKHAYIYNPELVTPNPEIVIDGKSYLLPADLGFLKYGQWEDVQQFLKHDRFGKTDWEKLPYILTALTHPRYMEDEIINNIDEVKKKFENITALEAMGALRFFQSREKVSYLTTAVSSLWMKKTEDLQMTTQTLSDMVRYGEISR